MGKKSDSFLKYLFQRLKFHNNSNSDDEPLKYKIDKADAQFAYENLVAIRNLEIDSLWKRITILLAIQAILFSVLSSQYLNFLSNLNPIQISFILFGVLTALISIFIIQGCSWWIDHWENDKLPKMEPFIGIEDFEIFRNHPHNDNIKQTIGYHSNRKWIMILFICLLLLWIFILVFSLFPIRVAGFFHF